jgi:hypothetical protein
MPQRRRQKRGAPKVDLRASNPRLTSPYEPKCSGGPFTSILKASKPSRTRRTVEHIKQEKRGKHRRQRSLSCVHNIPTDPDPTRTKASPVPTRLRYLAATGYPLHVSSIERTLAPGHMNTRHAQMCPHPGEARQSQANPPDLTGDPTLKAKRGGHKSARKKKEPRTKVRCVYSSQSCKQTPGQEAVVRQQRSGLALWKSWKTKMEGSRESMAGLDTQKNTATNLT